MITVEEKIKKLLSDFIHIAETLCEKSDDSSFELGYGTKSGKNKILKCSIIDDTNATEDEDDE